MVIMMDGTGEPAAPGTGMITYRYRVRGPVPDAVRQEVRRVHDLRNELVAIEEEYQDGKDAAWESDPEVAPVLAALRDAEEAAQAAGKALSQAKSRLGYAKKTGRTAAITDADEAARTAKAALAVARKARSKAKAREKEIKAARYGSALVDIAAAKARRDEAVRATYDTARDGGLYWASWNDAVGQHRTAAARVADRRKAGGPARQRYQRWDGTGTVAVQVQREQGVTAEERAEVSALRAAGKTPGEIAQLTRFAAQTIARMRDDGPAKPGDPPCSPAVLASGEGKWASQIQLSPDLPEDFASLPRRQRRRLARTGRMMIRTGSAAHAALTELPVTVHRPVHPAADVKMARLTVSRCGPDLEQHVSLTARIPAAAPAPGRVTAVHTGWRVLPDESLRVAVASPLGRVPPGVAATGCVRVHGDWAEIIIPAAWRAEQDRIEKERSVRDGKLNEIREQAARWLEDHPQGEDGTLPSPALVRQWRAPGRLVTLGRDCAAGTHGPAARPLGAILTEWTATDRAAWRNESHARRRLTRRRGDAWAKAAAWLCTGASAIILDEWEMPALARRPDRSADSDPQADAARANKVLAAPGELRQRLKITAGLAGVTVTEREPGKDGDGKAVQQGCWLCGEPLDPDQRRRQVMVRCPSGHEVDQDENMLRLMLRQ